MFSITAKCCEEPAVDLIAGDLRGRGVSAFGQRRARLTAETKMWTDGLDGNERKYMKVTGP